jgi:hypothetical protein
MTVKPIRRRRIQQPRPTTAGTRNGKLKGTAYASTPNAGFLERPGPVKRIKKKKTW